MLHKCLTPSNVLLVRSAIAVLCAVVTFVAPQWYIDLISIHDQKATERELLHFQLAGY